MFDRSSFCSPRRTSWRRSAVVARLRVAAREGTALSLRSFTGATFLSLCSLKALRFVRPLPVRSLLTRSLLVMAVMNAAAQAQDRQMYRYTNKEGNKVVAYQVPPEYVARGYEILSPTGALIDVVPAQLDASTRADMDAEARRQREAAEERERLRKWDESLLLRYSSVEDIEAARERALRDLRIRVSVLKGKLRSLKQQVENYQAMAADQERLGQDVNQEHRTAIADLRSEIASTERAVQDRQGEIASVDESYDRDVERFSSLLDIVEMRRNMENGDSG